MEKTSNAPLRARLTAIETEIPPYWRRMAVEIDKTADLSVMHDTLRGKSHNLKAIELFEKIAARWRKLMEVDV